MPKAIRIYQTGGPDVMRWEDVEVPSPGPGQVLVRHTAIGVNFVDIYDRSGLYPVPLPSGLGREAAGVVVALGRKVRGNPISLKVGDRVAYTFPSPGAYAETRVVSADRVVKLPPSVSDEQAAGMLLRGMTAWFLVRRTYPLKPGDTVLLHAAAGGVGLLVSQWARHLGARVIGVVSTAEKARLARSSGCSHVLLTSDDWTKQVRKLTRGEGVNVVYDSVGKDTFFASLDSLKPLGLMVTFGNASGPVPPLAPLELSRRGSLFLTRPTLFHYVAKRPDLERAARELFQVVRRGVVKIRIGQSYPLRDAATAHADLEARRTTGSTILLP
jgi:NADPH2:quinone reductase